MSSSRHEAKSYSRVYIRVLYCLIALQLVLGSITLLEWRAIRTLDSVLVGRHAALIHYQEQLDQVRRLVGTGETDPISASLPSVQRDTALQLSAALAEISQEKFTESADTLAAAKQQSQLYRRIATGEEGVTAMKQTLDRTAAALAPWQEIANQADLGYQQQQRAQSDERFPWIEWVLAINLSLVLAGVFCASMVRGDARRQASDRQIMEDELRRERSSLEKRIEARTLELQSEVTERQRAEQLNRGRNQVLEMLAREEPAQEIFQALAAVIARDRSRWCCALHLVRDGDLRIEAAGGLPASLLRSLQQLDIRMTDALEALALREQGPQSAEDLSRDRRPWPQLLFAHGIQSMWSVPIFGSDKKPLGTLTIYSLLRTIPTQADWEFLESHAQMAAMVLERYRLRDELRRHAYHDSLTGLPNRLLGEEQLSLAIRRGTRNATPVAVLWIDLDKFKQTNDVHGHPAGDAVLVEVAARLSQRLRGADTVARMGGDEFMAVLEGVASRAEAQTIAEQLLTAISAPIPFHQLSLSVAASIGISLFPEDGLTAEMLERNADTAMYEAKFGQRGVQVFSSTLNSAIAQRRELEQAMALALATSGFVLHYQPQYGMQGELARFEALVRLQHPRLGLLSPAQLIPIAEESDMIVTLGNWVLKEACSQAVRWQNAGYPPVSIAVNISSMQFARQDFAAQVAEVLHQTGLRPELLELELTESVMVKDFAESTKQLGRLKALGVSIAVDDFGTGYSSLNQLHRLPIDRLKIDRSFIQALNDPNGTLPIVESIILMAHRMGLLVVAEGVETQQQMQVLRHNDCDLLQGYLFSVPLTSRQASELLCSELSVRSIDDSCETGPFGSRAPVGVPETDAILSIS